LVKKKPSPSFTDDVKLGEIYLRSLQLGTDKRIRALGFDVRKSFTRVKNDTVVMGKAGNKVVVSRELMAWP
jgi:hypothetical protein